MTPVTALCSSSAGVGTLVYVDVAVGVLAPGLASKGDILIHDVHVGGE